MRLQCMVLGLLFFGIGFFFFIGKAIPMLKGWKNLSEKERKGINMSLLGKNVGTVLMSAGMIFEMSAWFPGFQEKAFVWCMIAWLVLTGIDVYDMEKSKRYLLKNQEEQEACYDKRR